MQITGSPHPLLETPFRRSLRFLDYLSDSGRLDESSIRRARQAFSNRGQHLETVLLELGLLEEARLLEALNSFLGHPILNDAPVPSDWPETETFDADLFLRAQLLPVNSTSDTLELATPFPLDDDAARSVAYAMGRRLELRIAPRQLVSNGLQAFRHAEVQGDPGQHPQDSRDSLGNADEDRLRDLASEAPTVKLLTRIVSIAVEKRASDIHIEPLIDSVRVRLRVDGVLAVLEELDKSHQMGLTSRIKILARLNIAEHRLPQDGRVRFTIRGQDIDFRVATSPALHGECVVLRILDRRELKLDFLTLGYEAAAAAKIQALLSKPNGVVLVTGPTGSGKTTTLYAALTFLNKPEFKIFTVEDPVEYDVKGLTQIPVRPQIGLDFANTLRSILRQDPNIIMVGEIRDVETAKITVQASLVGRLVLSTLHTNSAASAITRLADIGVEPFLIASTLRGVIAQRLVRKTCSACQQSSSTSAYGKSEGCPECGGTGFKGRTVIYEILEVTDVIQDAILRRCGETEIQRLAVAGGMQLLADVGRQKISAGETSENEVLTALGTV